MRLDPITDTEIRWVESVTGLIFGDSERVEALRRLDSIDVQACPGSGKTSLLVAKLGILARRWAERHRGICILSHTNVAKREIQSKLGAASGHALLSRPHFVGTIQTFVNTYLGIPAVRDLYGCHPNIIDTDKATRAAEKQLAKWKYASLRTYLERQNRGDLLGNLRFRGTDLLVHPRGRDEFGAATDSKSYLQLVELKTELAAAGIFCYADMFALAEAHIAKHPALKLALAHRFPLVFLDETQDTDGDQWRVLSTVFSGRSVIQRYGDDNQAIFRTVHEQSGVAFPEAPYAEISDSRRLSPSIARIVGALTPSGPRQLTGNERHPDLQHGLIVFSKATVLDVLPFFARQVLSTVSPIKSNPIAKAIGAIAKQGNDATRLPSGLRSYWPDLVTRIEVPSASFLSEVLQDSQITCHRSGSMADVMMPVCEFLAEVLREAGRKQIGGQSWTGRALLTSLRQEHSTQYRRLAHIIAVSIRRSLADPAWKLEKAGRHVAKVLEVFGGQLPSQGLAKLTNAPRADRTTAVDATRRAREPYRYVGPEGSLDIEVATIHSVKGETHDATLVLETFHRAHDTRRVLAHAFAPRRTRPSPGLLAQARRIYVAAGRPKYLLNFAMSEEGVTPSLLKEAVARDWAVYHL